MRRTLSLLLALALVLTMLPAMSFRAEAKTGGKLVALTFDDGPHKDYTPQLLDGLKARGVPVTFFMLGERAISNRSIVRRAYEEGHEIACHSWDHPNLTECSISEVQKQIENTLEELDRACGDEADYLVRPPYGSTNQKVRDAINTPLIYWSVDSEDWSLRNTEKVRRKIVADTYDGCIILCHDIHKTTIPAALAAVDELMDLGYEFVTVSELFRRRGRELEDHKLHYNSNKNGIDYGPIPAPKISVSGDSKGVNTVIISCSDKNVPLYYTLDGSYPNQSARRYTGPFTVPYGTKVTAVAAYKLNGSRSALTVKTADQIKLVAPTITLDEVGNVVMTTPTVDSEIHFTVNDTPPGVGSRCYDGPEAITGGCFIRAVTIHEKGSSAETRVYLSPEGNLYYDINAGLWYYDAMDWCYQNGIMAGVAAYTMNPSGVVTRGMMVALLYRFSGDSLGADWERTNTFSDVKESQYYAEAIEWAYRNQIVNGYSSDYFGHKDVVTRQQMCTIIAAFLKWNGTPLHKAESNEGRFGDYDKVSAWARSSMDSMVAAGMIVGDGKNLNPGASTSRAQFCTILKRVAEFIENYVPEEELPDHEHQWKLNLSQDNSITWATETINEGDFLELFIECEECGEIAPVEWVAEPDGVVLVEEYTITGVLGGNSAMVQAVWEDVMYECLVYVRAPGEDSTEPTDPEEPTKPTEPAPTEPKPTEPEHVHDWKLNKSVNGSDTTGDVSINVGETFPLRILCKSKDCTENAPITWSPSKEGVVKINGMSITGLKAGSNTTLSAEWEGETYSCIVRVRKQTNDVPVVTEPV